MSESSTNQCRVLTDDIEIHWWDGTVKSAGECLCGGAALKAEGSRPRGVCPQCQKTYALTKSGRVWRHASGWLQDCSGTGQEPVKAGDPT